MTTLQNDGASARTAGRSPRMGWMILAGAVILMIAGVWAQCAAVRRARAARTQRSTGAGKGRSGMNASSVGTDMSSNNGVLLSPSQIREFGITLATATVRPLVAETRATGVVAVDERHVTQVTPRVNGFAERVYADFTGRVVQRGASLLELYSPEIIAAEQELLLARQLPHDVGGGTLPGVPGDTADLGTNLVAAARQRLMRWDVPSSEIDEVLRTGRVRRTITLRSPASGVIVQKAVVQGGTVSANMPLYTIADLSTIWVNAQLREADAGAVRIGSSVTVELTAYPGRYFTGTVDYISPMVDSATRAIQARITVVNTAGLLKPGMYATVRLSTPARSVLTVPSSAVLRTGERNVVFIAMAQGRLVPQAVAIGRSAGDLTEILSGVEPGQRVVTSAQYLLDSESHLSDVMGAMLGQTGTSDMGASAGTPGMQDMPGMQLTPTTQGMQGVPGVSAPRER